MMTVWEQEVVVVVVHKMVHLVDFVQYLWEVVEAAAVAVVSVA